jgi:galacturan 1,4-alpha-galacturonidase
VWDGHGVGTLDGNGQTWYDYNENRSNLARRPININYRHFSNSVVRNMRFVQSQMWTMVLCYGQNVLLDNIYVNSTSTSQWGTVNTDGIDTIWSDNITMRRWTVDNGDDSVALKDNSTNIYLEDSLFYNGQGIAIGSIGQFKGNYSYIENFYARNITGYNTNYAAYVKTWPGIQDGYPPNGGGGGLGFARNLVIQDVTLHQARSDPIYMEQCENYEGHELQSCNTSLFKLEDVLWSNIAGTTVSTNDYAGTFLCSGAAGGCSNITVQGFDVKKYGTDEVASIWHCENVNGEGGFTCTAGSSRP